MTCEWDEKWPVDQYVISSLIYRSDETILFKLFVIGVHYAVDLKQIKDNDCRLN